MHTSTSGKQFFFLGPLATPRGIYEERIEKWIKGQTHLYVLALEAHPNNPGIIIHVGDDPHYGAIPSSLAKVKILQHPLRAEQVRKGLQDFGEQEGVTRMIPSEIVGTSPLKLMPSAMVVYTTAPLDSFPQELIPEEILAIIGTSYISAEIYEVQINCGPAPCEHLCATDR